MWIILGNIFKVTGYQRVGGCNILPTWISLFSFTVSFFPFLFLATVLQGLCLYFTFITILLAVFLYARTGMSNLWPTGGIWLGELFLLALSGLLQVRWLWGVGLLQNLGYLGPVDSEQVLFRYSHCSLSVAVILFLPLLDLPQLLLALQIWPGISPKVQIFVLVRKGW